MPEPTTRVSEMTPEELNRRFLSPWSSLPHLDALAALRDAVVAEQKAEADKRVEVARSELCDVLTALGFGDPMFLSQSMGYLLQQVRAMMALHGSDVRRREDAEARALALESRLADAERRGAREFARRVLEADFNA